MNFFLCILVERPAPDFIQQLVLPTMYIVSFVNSDIWYVCTAIILFMKYIPVGPRIKMIVKINTLELNLRDECNVSTCFYMP